MGSALYLESSSRDLGFPALSRERLELLPPVAKVDGEQLEPLGSALSSRPKYIVDLLCESSSRLGFRALERLGAPCSISRAAPASGLSQLPWSTVSSSSL